MAEQDQVEAARTDANAEAELEGMVGDMLFGKPHVPDPQEPEDDYEPGPNAQVEGDDESEEGDDEEVEAKDETEAAEGALVEVEINGKLYEVPEEIKDGYLRQQDYTTKTQEVSARRKETEVLFGQVQDAHKAFEFAESIREDVLKAELLQAEEKQLEEYLSSFVNSPDYNSQAVEQIRLRMNQLRNERNDIAQSVQGKQQEFQQAREQSRQELLKKGTEVLRSKIPNWNEEQEKLVFEAGIANGFTEQELQYVANLNPDPRQIAVLWKAAQYDALQAGKGAAVKKVQKAPVIRPKARDPETGRFAKEAKLKKALKSNLSASDKAGLIGDDIASRFFGS